MAIPRPPNNYTYRLLPVGTAVQRSDGAIVPPDPKNADWKAYQAWLAAGHTPSPAPTPPAVVHDIYDLLDRLTPAQQLTLFTNLVNGLNGLTAAEKAALLKP